MDLSLSSLYGVFEIYTELTLDNKLIFVQKKNKLQLINFERDRKIVSLRVENSGSYNKVL